MDYLEDMLVTFMFELPAEATPIFDQVFEDHEAAFDAGVAWHPHWRLEVAWAQPDPDFPF